LGEFRGGGIAPHLSADRTSTLRCHVRAARSPRQLLFAGAEVQTITMKKDD
jgi:hypothetical protein